MRELRGPREESRPSRSPARLLDACCGCPGGGSEVEKIGRTAERMVVDWICREIVPPCHTLPRYHPLCPSASGPGVAEHRLGSPRSLGALAPRPSPLHLSSPLYPLQDGEDPCVCSEARWHATRKRRQGPAAGVFLSSCPFERRCGSTLGHSCAWVTRTSQLPASGGDKRRG